MNPFLLAAILLPGIPIDLMPAIDIVGDSIVIEEQTGDGKTADLGCLATLVINVDVVQGKRLFDTEKRGLPYTVKMGDSAWDPRVSSWVQGMRVGGQRTIFTDFSETNNSLVPTSTPLSIHVRLVDLG